jgi:hypothetical protein
MWPLSIMRFAVPGLEHFKLREHARIPDRHCHRFEMGGRIDEHVRAHVEAAHIQAADVGLELEHVPHALGRQPERGSWSRLLRVLLARNEARPRARGEVDEDVGPAVTDPLHHFAIERELHARAGGLRVAHMDVNNGGPGFGGVDRGLGNLWRGHGHSGVSTGRVRRARHRTRDHDLALHAFLQPDVRE